jgi:hypothetical protein
MRAKRADFQRLDWQIQLIDWGCGRREVQDRILRAFDEDIVGEIVLDIAEPLVTGQVSDIVGAAGDQVIHRDNRMPLGQEAIGEVRAKEASATSDQNAHSVRTPQS